MLFAKEDPAVQHPSWLTGAVLAYLALPNLLFAAGWLQPVPAIAMIGAVLYLVSRLCMRSTLPARLPVGQRAGAWLWCALALVLIVWIISTGMTGHCAQFPDFLVRNAVFATLVRCDWPLALPDGSDFIYYLSSWLPPALAARLHPTGSFPLLCLSGWNFLGLLLMCLLLERKLGRRVLVFLLLFILADSFAPWIRMGVKNIYGENLIFCKYFSYFYATGTAQQMANTYHHVIPVWLALSLFFSGALTWGRSVCVSSLVMLASPLGSIGLGIFLFLMLFVPRGEAIRRLVSLLKEPALYCGVLTGLAALLYFKANESSSNIGFFWQFLPPDPWWVKIGKCALGAFAGTGITVCLILWLARVTGHLKEPLVWVAVSMLVLLPVAMIGLNYNELLFKASCIPYWILPWLLTHWFPTANRKQKLCIAIFVLLGAGGAAGAAFFCYKYSKRPLETRIRSEWQGHLYHPDHAFYCQFKGKIKPAALFYTEAGASAQTLLSWCRRDNRSDTEPLPPQNPWSADTQRPR